MQGFQTLDTFPPPVKEKLLKIPEKNPRNENNYKVEQAGSLFKFQR